MLRVEIKDTTVRERQGNNERGAWRSREQDAYVYTYNDAGALNPYPEKITIRLNVGQGNTPDQPPYALGNYMIHPSCFYVGQYSSLQLGRLRLIPEGEFKALTAHLKAA